MKPEEICLNRASKKLNFLVFLVDVLLPFMVYVDSLNYEDKPDYGYLRHVLIKILLDKDLVPDSVYDWDVN